MKRPLAYSAFFLSFVLAGCASQPTSAPAIAAAEAEAPAPAPAIASAPVAQKRDFLVTAPHGAARQDEYYWLRDDTRKDADMLAYLNAENAWADQAMAPLQSLRESLYEELVGRVKQDDASVPYLKDGYWYYTRFEAGKEYPIHARRKGSMEAPEQVMFDVNQMAEGKNFFQFARIEISPDGRLAAFTYDEVGRRQMVVQVKDLETGRVLADRITGASNSLMWGDDNRTLYYIENDPTTLLTKRVKRHVLGTPVASDAVVYEEADDTFYMGIGRTRSDDYLCIGVESTVS
ncbi:MAG TPA: S9 family peptidase, partial [Arenimonas sp.]|nr:S9 family peptidase [Arenimonas sp.]